MPPHSDPPVEVMNSEAKALVNLMGTSHYSLPPIQRDYSWKKENAIELFDDLSAFVETTHEWYFCGPVVELNSNEEHLIVDGQQRYATFTILFCALRDYLYWKKHERTLRFNRENQPEEEAEEGTEEENEEEGEDIEDPQKFPIHEGVLFQEPEITVDNLNLKFKQHAVYPTIEELAKYIDRTLIVDLDDVANPKVRLTLKNNDEMRLKFLQNPSWDTKYNNDCHDRTLPPGRLDPEKTEVRNRGGGTPRLYGNYDYFIEQLDLKFNSFGTTVEYNTVNEEGDYIPVTSMVPGQGAVVETGILHTEEQLKEAFNWFEKFFRRVSQNVSFARMKVGDWATAYEIFLSTNTKGVPLSLADIVRAMILSKLQNEDVLDEATANLDRVSNEIDASEQSKFIRAYWISRNAEKQSASSIAKLMATKIRDSDSGELLALTAEIANDVDNYKAVMNPVNNTEFGQVRNAFLNCGVRQHIPLMMACERLSYDEPGKKLVHNLVESLYIVHNVVNNGSPSKYEALFAEASGSVNNGDATQDVVDSIVRKATEQLFAHFTQVNFKNKFAEINGESENVFQYIFRKIENKLQHESNSQGVEHHVQVLIGDNMAVNLEHILPKSIRAQQAQYWRDNFGPHEGARHKENLWKIGNLTLLDKMLNQVNASNKPFPDKVEAAYRARTEDDDEPNEDGRGKEWSTLLITNKLAESDDWTEEEIVTRGRWLAGNAAEIWASVFGLPVGEEVGAEAPEEQPENNNDEEAGPAGEEE